MVVNLNSKADKARLDNRWGCSVGHAFRNFIPPSRLHAHPRPGGRHSLDVRPTRRAMPDVRKFFFNRGGARTGLVNYPWPLATFTADSERIIPTTTMFGLFETGRYDFTPAQVTSIE